MTLAMPTRQSTVDSESALLDALPQGAAVFDAAQQLRRVNGRLVSMVSGEDADLAVPCRAADLGASDLLPPPADRTADPAAAALPDIQCALMVRRPSCLCRVGCNGPGPPGRDASELSSAWFAPGFGERTLLVFVPPTSTAPGKPDRLTRGDVTSAMTEMHPAVRCLVLDQSPEPCGRFILDNEVAGGRLILGAAAGGRPCVSTTPAPLRRYCPDLRRESIGARTHDWRPGCRARRIATSLANLTNGPVPKERMATAA